MDGWPNSNPPRSKNLFFFLFFLPFSKTILKPAELSSLRNIVSSLYQLFVPRFAMAVFMCIYLHYCIHKQRNTFKLSSILWTVDLSKHLIKAWTYKKFIQLDNFLTFSVFFFFFGNRVRLNLYEQALSCFREMRLAQLRGTSVFKNVRAKMFSMQSISLQ